MNAKKRAQKIQAKLEAIMVETFYDCKSRNQEVASKAHMINTLAHECTKELEKLISVNKSPDKDWNINKGQIT